MVADIAVGVVPQLTPHATHSALHAGVLMGFLAVPSHLFAPREAQASLGMPSPLTPPAAKLKNNPQKLESLLLHPSASIAFEHGPDFVPQLGRDFLIGIQVQNPRLRAK